jgi:hypothetical protein
MTHVLNEKQTANPRPVLGLRKREHGIARLTLAVFLPLLFVGLYAAYHITPFYYNYFELQNQMDSLVRVAGVYTDEELRRKLATQMKVLEINASIDDVRIERFGNTMRMSLQYEETFWIEWKGEEYEVHTFDFDATVERDFSS